MGTNYYVAKTINCPHCGDEIIVGRDDSLHIGKSSGGWCFTLHVIPEERLHTWEDWKEFLKHKVIVDEYGDEMTLNEFRPVVEDREWGRRITRSDEEMRRNHAVPGPNNLVRHAIDGRHCVGHGSGTWDLCVGEFC